MSVIFTGSPLESKRCKSPLRTWIRDLLSEGTGSTQEPSVRRSRIHDLLHLFDSKGLPEKITDTCNTHPLRVSGTLTQQFRVDGLCFRARASGNFISFNEPDHVFVLESSVLEPAGSDKGATP